MCKFCSESNVWTRWRCRRCYHDIPAGLRGLPIAARTGEWSAGSSTSSGEEDRKSKSLEAEIEELRARFEALEKEGRKEPKEGMAHPRERERHGGRVENGHGP